jgi:adenylate cyclase
MAADVAGYSRLMEADERATVATLDTYRAVFQARVAGHGGRIVDTAGDSVLAVFPSAIGAVQAALEIQTDLGNRNETLPEDQRMRFRLGVNLGDVIEKDDGSVYGSGVNVAARLEGLAEPGGICLSGSAHEQVEGKTEYGFEDIGEHEVKNIARPVRVYRLIAEARPTMESEAEGPSLPSRPSIAVLPFANISGDPEQEFFADGIAEDLITALSGLRWLFVTARNSTFVYKDQSPDVRDVGQSLGVRYVLEGSVRKGGNRVRVTAQLIDATTGNHVWAQRYDRELEDIFAVQDEITESIVRSIGPELDAAERERARRKSPKNLDAWECYQRGLWHFYRFNYSDNLAAQELLRRAADLDPTFSSALAVLGWSYLFDSLLGFTEDHEASRKKALEATRAALRCDEADPLAHTVMCRIHFASGDVVAAVAAARTALGLNPNLAAAHFYLGDALRGSGQMENALVAIDEAMRLSPRDPFLWAFENIKAHTLLFMQRNEESLEYARKAVSHPGATGWAYATLASVLGHLGRRDEARAALDDLWKVQSDFSPEFVRKAYAGIPGEQWDHLFEGLRKAGLDIPNEPVASD